MKRSSRRLFWRIYLLGLLMVLGATFAATVATILAQPESRFHGSPLRLHQVLAAELVPVLDQPQALATTLGRLARAMDSSAAIYRRNGQRILAVGEAPPPPLTATEMPDIGNWHPVHRQDGGWVHAVPLGDANAPYLLMEGVQGGYSGLLAALAAVLLLVALVSWPLARALARPLERLTSTAYRLARGELSARSGVVRRDELGELASAFDEMAARLEERIRTEKELFANLSHEIRTPLARLRVALELLEDAPGDGEQTLERLHGIGTDLTELEVLMDNVLTSSRLDLGRREGEASPLHLQPVKLQDLLDEAEQRFCRYYPHQPLSAHCANTSTRLQCDLQLMLRVLANLLDNAAKYNRDQTPIELVAGSDTHVVWIEVRDRGEGVAPEDLERLFEPFFRAHRCRSRQSGGTGLGLTLCKRIIEAHGGRIQARLNQDAGMVLRVEIPAGNDQVTLRS